MPTLNNNAQLFSCYYYFFFHESVGRVLIFFFTSCYFLFFFSLFFLLRILRYYMPMIPSLFNTTRNPFGRAHTVGDGGIQSWHRSKKRCRLDRYEEKARSIENVCIRPSVRGMPFSLPNFHFYEYFLSPSWLQAKKKKKGKKQRKRAKAEENPRWNI